MIDPARITSLDAPTALRLLSTVARPRLRAAGLQTSLTPDLAEALRDTFGPPAPDPPADADLARDALLLLAADPGMEPPLAALLDGPQPERFDAAETVALVVGALVVLQTHVRFERTAAGKWKVLLDKPTTSDSLLKPLVQKLLALLPGAGTGRG